jgi:hypothetical protein
LIQATLDTKREKDMYLDFLIQEVSLVQTQRNQ